MANLESRFQQQKEQAREALQQLPALDPADNRVYNFEAAEAVINQAKRMLASCENIAVIDGFPAVLKLLADELIDLASQGKQVFVLAYEEIDLPGCDIEFVESGQFRMDQLFQAQQLNLVVDSHETLLALLTLDMAKVKQAVWSQSVYLSFIMHVGLLRQHDAHELLNIEETTVDYSTIQKIVAIDERFSPLEVPGIRKLMPGLDVSNF